MLACAAHGLFTGKAAMLLADANFDAIVVTDSVPSFRLSGGGLAKLRVAPAAGLFADAIRDSHLTLPH